jgi:hypothetical protein
MCETPLGIREVEHLLGFLTGQIDQGGEQHKKKKKALWVKCKKPPVLGCGVELFLGK